MQQHPVPQQIASYEFRLVGDMTLKQFGWLAGGAIIALFFYSLPIVPLIKWSLIATSGFLGFAFAFLPIEERPLSTWLIAFFRAIFSPTFFFWQKTKVIPGFFTYQPSLKNNLTPTLPPVNTAQLNEYLQTLTQKNDHLDRQRTEAPSPKSELLKRPEPTEAKKEESKSLQPQVKSPLLSQKTKPNIKKSLIVPGSTKPKNKPKNFKTQESFKDTGGLPSVAQTNKPNLLTGVVLSPSEEMVAEAILEVKNTQGVSVRAFKTNKLGQFMIATPLENGVYQIEIEKEGLSFDIIKVETRGEVIPPLRIKAK